MKKLISVILFISLIASCALSMLSCSKEGGAEGPVAYILAEKGNAYSLGLAESIKFAFEGKGGVATMETFPSGTEDFSEFYTKASELEADVIFLPNSMEYAEKLLKDADGMEVSVPIIAGDTWETPAVLEAVKDTDLTVYFTSLFDESVAKKTSTGDEFIAAFKKFLSENSEYYEMNGASDTVASVSVMGFDAYNVTIAAIRKAAERKGVAMTSTDVAVALWETEHKGISGDIVFDENKDAVRGCAYIEMVTDKGFELVSEQNVESDAARGKAPEYDVGGVLIDTENKRINVGVYEPTTGPDAAGGKQELLGVIYAHSLDKTVVIGGEEYEVVLCQSDNGSNPTYAQATATKLVENRCIAVIGSYGSTVSIAATEVFEGAMIPVVGASCTNADVTFGNKYYFRIAVTDTLLGAAMAEYALSMIKE